MTSAVLSPTRYEKSPTYRRRYEQGLCICCGKQAPRQGKATCAECGAKVVESNRRYRDRNRDRYNDYQSRYSKTWRFERRMRVLYHYGGTPPCCACCGLTATSGMAAIAFFTVDHIHGYDSNSGEPRAADALVDWILKNDYPSGFQILCHNCNMARSILGKCPHEIEWDMGPPGVFLDGGGI